MKLPIHIVISLILLVACNSDNGTIEEKKIVTESIVPYSEFLEKADEDMYKFDSILKGLYILADKNTTIATFKADSLIAIYSTDYKKTRFSPNLNKISDLHFFKGELYYRNEDYRKSVGELSIDSFANWDIGIAAAYIKLTDYNHAYKYIRKAMEYGYNYHWELGNYYEIIGAKDSAIAIYQRLCSPDNVQDKFIFRLNELKKKNPKLLDELSFPTGRPE